MEKSPISTVQWRMARKQADRDFAVHGTAASLVTERFQNREIHQRRVEKSTGLQNRSSSLDDCKTLLLQLIPRLRENNPNYWCPRRMRWSPRILRSPEWIVDFFPREEIVRQYIHIQPRRGLFHCQVDIFWILGYKHHFNRNWTRSPANILSVVSMMNANTSGRLQREKIQISYNTWLTSWLIVAGLRKQYIRCYYFMTTNCVTVSGGRSFS